jgi:hypothetical protein
VASRKRRSARIARRHRPDNRGRKRSRSVVVPFVAERAAGARDLGRIDSGARRKRDQETLIAKHMLEHAGEKALPAGGSADLRWLYTRRIEEAREPLRLFGDECKRLNGHNFRRFPCSP